MQETSRFLLPAVNNLYSLGFAQSQITEVVEKLNNLITQSGVKPGYDVQVSRLLHCGTRSDQYYLIHHAYAYSPSHEVSIGFIKDPINVTKEEFEHRKNSGDAYNNEISPVMLNNTDTVFLLSLNMNSSTKLTNMVAIDTITTQDIPALTQIAEFLYIYSEFVSFMFEGASPIQRHFATYQEFFTAFKQQLISKHTNFNAKSQFIDCDMLEDQIQTLFSSATHKAYKVTKQEEYNLESTAELSVITDVYEEANVRVALSQIKVWNGIEKRLTIYPLGHQDYNYVDPGRFYINTRKDRLTVIETALGKTIFTENAPPFPTYEVLKKYFIDNTTSTSPKYVNNLELKTATKRFAQSQKYEKDEELATRVLEAKVKAKLTKLKIPGESLKINEVTYTHDSIEYQGQVLKLTSQTDWVYNLLARLTRATSFNNITFDSVFDLFLHEISKLDGQARSGQIGDVTFDLKLVAQPNINGVVMHRHLINGIKINKDELRECFERALCFRTQAQYDAFLKSVSKCSLLVHKHLHEGIALTLWDDFTSTRLSLTLPLERERGSNYLAINGKMYKVKDTQRLFRLPNKQSLLEVVNELLGEAVVYGVTVNDIHQIIEAGKQEYINNIERGKKLVSDTEKLFKLVRQYGIILNNKITVNTGYIIKGHLRTYCVDAEEGNKVYSYPDGRYLCMVDKGSSTTNAQDRLVNRLYALHNDKYVSDMVDTLQE